MKDKSIAIAMFIAVALVVCGWFISMAVSYIGDTEDDIVTQKQQIENY